MILTEEKGGLYVANMRMLNREIEGMNPVDVAKMMINLTRLDIMIEEIKTVREDRYDMNEVYRMLNNNEEGNPMRHGARWRARVMMVVKEIFNRILHAGNVTDMYNNHRRVIENFIKENRWTEDQELIGIGWVETTTNYTYARSKLTKRQGQNFHLRLEIFETKKQLIQKVRKDAEIGKKINLFIKI